MHLKKGFISKDLVHKVCDMLKSNKSEVTGSAGWKLFLAAQGAEAERCKQCVYKWQTNAKGNEKKGLPGEQSHSRKAVHKLG